MNAHLIIEHGDNAGKKIELKDEVRAGRTRSNYLILNDQRASREHFLIKREGENFSIKDLDSRNGTYVNDERILKTTILSSGDVISVGSLRFRFDLEGQKIVKKEQEKKPKGKKGESAKKGLLSKKKKKKLVYKIMFYLLFFIFLVFLFGVSYTAGFFIYKEIGGVD